MQWKNTKLQGFSLQSQNVSLFLDFIFFLYSDRNKQKEITNIFAVRNVLVVIVVVNTFEAIQDNL